MPARTYTDAQLKAAVASARNMREVLISLGLVPRGGNYETVWRRISDVGLDGSHLRRVQGRGSLRSCSDEEIQRAVEASRSVAEVLRRLRLGGGSSHERLKVRIATLGLDTSHFLGAAWRRGSSIPVVPRRPLSEFLGIGPLRKTSSLRERLIREGVKEPRCESCHRDEWMGQSIPLELDHVNGKRDDNRLENLRLLCPNCHAQTTTYRGRNIGNGYQVS